MSAAAIRSRRENRPSQEELSAVAGELLDQAATPMALVGFDGRVRQANAPFARLLGRDESNLLGLDMLEITHPDDRQSSRTARRRAGRGEGGMSMTKRYLTPGGADVWARITVSTLRDSDGTPFCMLTQAEDVSEERRLRRRVQELDQLRTALSECNEAMLRADSVPDLLRRACQVAVDHGGMRMAWIGVRDQAGWVERLATAGDPHGYLAGLRITVDSDSEQGQGPVGTALRTARPVVFQDVLEDRRFLPWADRARRAGFLAVGAFPLLDKEELRGAMAVYSREANFFDPEKIGLLLRLSDNVAFAWGALEARLGKEVAARELQDSLEQFHKVFEHTAVANAILDLQLRFGRVNAALGELLGVDPAGLQGRSLLDFVHPDDRQQLLRIRRRLRQRPEVGITRLQHRLVAGNGEVIHVLASGTLMPAVESSARYVVWQAQNITAQLRAEASATRRSAQQAAIAELGRQALERRDLDALMQSACALLAEHLRLTHAAVLRWLPGRDQFRLVAGVGWPEGKVGAARVPAGKRSQAGYALLHPGPVVTEDFRTERRFDSRQLAEEYHFGAGVAASLRPDGRPFGVISAHCRERRRFSDEDLSFLQGIANVVGAAVARQSAEDQIHVQALHDALTGLPNRTLLMDRIALALSRLAREPACLAVMFLDLDRFKVVNDSLGHAIGDALLCEVSSRLRRILRPTDTVSRVGGDEFVVVAEGVDSEEVALRMANRLARALEPPVKVDGSELVATASVGVVTSRDPRARAGDLLRDADIAMYRAKAQGGRAAVLFAPSMRDAFGDRVQVEADLHRALRLGQFAVHYQPIFAVRSGRIEGAEALVRWNHPGRGLVPPGDFIPLAEETGAILELGEFVLRTACLRAAGWARRRGEGAHIAVNLSTRQLQDPGLIEVVRGALAGARITPDQLTLEITETAVLADSLAASSALAELTQLGVRLAVDDFGTGYSSVAHLQRFRLHQLKIDRGFVAGLGANQRDRAIVDGLVKLAHAVGLEAAAEGVETEQQLQVLRDLGCDLAQGFLLSPPLPPAEFEDYWRTVAISD